jgi:hypothetical protein
MSKNKPNPLDLRDEWRRQILCDSRLTHAQKIVALIIADRFEYSGKPFRLSARHICDALGVDAKTVQRTANKLVEIGALQSYQPGYRRGDHKYSSRYRLNLTFLSDNALFNDAANRSWQVQEICSGTVSPDGVITLTGPASPVREAEPAKGTHQSDAKGTGQSNANGTAVSTIPSLSISPQRDRKKEEGITPSAGSGGGTPDGVPHPPGDGAGGGFNELKENFPGRVPYPRDAAAAYAAAIADGHATHDQLMQAAINQKEGIENLEDRKRPDLAKWITRGMYDRSDGSQPASPSGYDASQSL